MNNPIDKNLLGKIATPEIAESILVALSLQGHLKATYRPHCKDCGAALAGSYETSHEAQGAVAAGHCSECERFVGHLVGYEVRLIWALGADTGIKGVGEL